MKEASAVLAPERYRVLSGSVLKVIAVVSMLIDHVTKRILVANPAYLQPLPLPVPVSVVWLGETIGRLAFPIFCFLLVEGFVYTRSRALYARNLLLFALVSEVPFDLSRTLTPFDPTYQNVFFTLLVSFLGLWAYEGLQDRTYERVVSVLGLALVSMGLSCDYGCRGYALVLIMYVLRHDALAKTALGSCVTLATWRAGLAFIPINLYNGTRGFVKGPVLKFLFYAFYPAHLFVLWRMRLSMGI